MRCTLGLDLDQARRSAARDESVVGAGAADLPPGFPALDSNL